MGKRNRKTAAERKAEAQAAADAQAGEAGGEAQDPPSSSSVDDVPALRELLGPDPRPAQGREPADGDGNGRDGGGSDARAADRKPDLRAPDTRLWDALGLVEEADLLFSLHRWALQHGRLPEPKEWLNDERWPHPDNVNRSFKSWRTFVERSGLADAPALRRLREAEELKRTAAAREREVERELARVADTARRADLAQRRREEAEAARDEAEGRVGRLERSLEAAEARAKEAEARLAERRETAPAEGADGTVPRAEHDDVLAQIASISAHRDELERRAHEAEDELRRAEATIAELRRAAAAGEEVGAASADALADAPPPTVADAVARAEHEAQALRFTDLARESAADSPYRRPQEILDALRKLDELAVLYDQPGGFGASLSQAATERGLNWRQDVSEFARSRKPLEYSVVVDGHRVDLGPHVALGSGSGAQFIARIYLHVADGSGPLERGLYVGHVGRHLPDTTT